VQLEYDFIVIGTSIAKLLFLVATGYILRMRGLIDDKFTDMLSLLLIRVIFPALIISKTISHFDPGAFPYWWSLPIAAVLFSAVGMLISGGVARVFFRGKSGREFMCASAFQNCGYLAMNIIFFTFSGLVRDRMLICLFLFTAGFNFLMWSLVPIFLSRASGRKMSHHVLFNPPVIAIVFSVLWVFALGKGSLPAVVMDPLGQLGQASFPVAMLTLGSYLYKYKAYNPEFKRTVAVSAFIKLFLYPVALLFILRSLSVPMEYKFFLFLQSTMPTAVSLVVIGSYTGADNKFISSSIFYTHLIALFIIPIWMALFKFLM